MFAFKGAAPDVPLRDIFAATWPFVVIIHRRHGDHRGVPAALATYLPSLL